MQARRRQLPFTAELVGSHWDKDAQVDVVAINWQDRAILLGKCKWGINAVGRSVIRELVNKTPLVILADDWQVSYVFFARAGFTDAAHQEAQLIGAQLVDLAQLDDDLQHTLENPG